MHLLRESGALSLNGATMTGKRGRLGVMLGGFGVVAILFAAAVWFFSDDAAARLAAQQAMVDDAPNQFREGETSGLLTGGTIDDVTGRHPAYLLGAIAAAAGAGGRCTPATLKIAVTTADCHWNDGSFRVYSSTMPVLILRKKLGPNKFDDAGRPLKIDGNPLDYPIPYDQHSATEFRLEYRAGLFNNLNGRLAALFTSTASLPATTNGIWVGGNASLGYRSCNYYRYKANNGSTDGLALTCYQR